MNVNQSFRVGVVTGTLILLMSAATQAASSSTVVLETGYSDSGQPVVGADVPSGRALTPGAAAGPLAGNAAETARIQPVDPAGSAGSDFDAALLAPGTLVVAPGSGLAPRANAQGPTVLSETPAPSLLYPALMALVAMAPLVGWLLVSRRGRSRPARHSHKALADALAASVTGAGAEAAKPFPFLPSRRARSSSRSTRAAGTSQPRDEARRELEEALRRGPDPSPNGEAAEIARLRSEVLDGLREMKARVSEFTEALEMGKAELQSELSRAERTVDLLRTEREDFEQAVRLSPRRPRNEFADEFHEDHRGSAPPVSFRPPRIESVGAAPKPAPTLDPAWMLLDDEGDGVWTPPAANPVSPARPATPAAPTTSGTTAVRELVRRGAVAASGGDDPRERRRRIVEMARNGRTIDDISRELRVGRGEVTLTLSRVR